MHILSVKVLTVLGGIYMLCRAFTMCPEIPAHMGLDIDQEYLLVEGVIYLSEMLCRRVKSL